MTASERALVSPTHTALQKLSTTQRSYRTITMAESTGVQQCSDGVKLKREAEAVIDETERAETLAVQSFTLEGWSGWAKVRSASRNMERLAPLEGRVLDTPDAAFTYLVDVYLHALSHVCFRQEFWVYYSVTLYPSDVTMMDSLIEFVPKLIHPGPSCVDGLHLFRAKVGLKIYIDLLPKGTPNADQLLRLDQRWTQQLNEWDEVPFTPPLKLAHFESYALCEVGFSWKVQIMPDLDYNEDQALYWPSWVDDTIEEQEDASGDIGYYVDDRDPVRWVDKRCTCSRTE